MTNKTLAQATLVFIFSLIGGGILSVYFGKELCWDLANYHYYTPFALLNHRSQIDYFPSSYIHQFINPTIDFLTYFLISDFSPRLCQFIIGMIHGLNFWLLFLIARCFLQSSFAFSLSIFLAVMGILGPTVLPGIGSFQNDNFITLFVLGFVYLQIRSLFVFQQTGKMPWFYQIISGLLLGLGFGLKLTAGIYIFGALIASLLLPISFKTRCKVIALWGIAAIIGMLITNGYWMMILWKTHHNPFFPFFNSIFHAPDFPDMDWRDKRFLPKTIMQTLFYPFYFSWDGLTADAPFRDVRFIVVYILFVWLGLKWVWDKAINHDISRAHKNKILSLPQQWLFLFFIFSYLIWQYYFSIARYLAGLEMLAPLIIFLLLREFITNKTIFFSAVFLAFYLLIFFLSPIEMMRAPWYDTTYFNVKMPEAVARIPKATVLMAYAAYVMDRDPRPQFYLIPFFPRQWRFIGVPFLQQAYFPEQATTENIKQKLQGDTHPIYLLTADAQMPMLYQTAKLFNLMPDGPCEEVESDRQMVTHQNVLLCPVIKIKN